MTGVLAFAVSALVAMFARTLGDYLTNHSNNHRTHGDRQLGTRNVDNTIGHREKSENREWEQHEG